MIREEIEQAARRIRRVDEQELAKRTDECLTAACIFRYKFQLDKGRQPLPGECPRDCPYLEWGTRRSSPGRRKWRTDQ